MKKTETYSAEETFAFGRQIGQQAKAGEVYTLVGDLGVGKTVLTQHCLASAACKYTSKKKSKLFPLKTLYSLRL